jgi:hypothetical protein
VAHQRDYAVFRRKNCQGQNRLVLMGGLALPAVRSLFVAALGEFKLKFLRTILRIAGLSSEAAEASRKPEADAKNESSS